MSQSKAKKAAEKAKAAEAKKNEQAPAEATAAAATAPASTPTEPPPPDVNNGPSAGDSEPKKPKQTEGKKGQQMIPAHVTTMASPMGKRLRVVAKVNSSLHDGTQLEIGQEAHVFESEFNRIAAEGRLDFFFSEYPK